MTKAQEHAPQPPVVRHDLDPTEMAQGEQQLIDMSREKLEGQEGVVAVWISPQNPLANVVRTHEAHKMPEFPAVMADYEMSSMFLALMDTRDGADRMVHAFRVTGAARDEEGNVGVNPEIRQDKTGIVLKDDVIESDQGLTIQDFYDYYTAKGVDLKRTMSVESNFRIGEKKVPRYNGLPMSNVGYLALFNLIESRGGEEGEAVIFAALNRLARVSLSQAGVEYEPLVGREDLRTPSVDDEGNPTFDDNFQLVGITESRQNMEAFTAILPFAAPQIYI